MKKLFPAICPALVLIACFHAISHADTDSLRNIEPGEQIIVEEETPLAPGMTVILPDGRRTLIREIIANGQLLTDMGIVLSQEGVILEGENKGQIVISAKKTAEMQTPEDIILEEKTTKGEKGGMSDEKESHAGGMNEEQVQPGQTAASQDEAAQTPQAGSGSQQTGAASAEAAEGFSIAELLPSTPDRPDQEGGAEQAAGKAASKSESSQKSTRKAAESASSGKKAEAKMAEAKKARQEAEQAASRHNRQETRNQARAKPGQELRIPEGAASRGDLSFLEGCWQGTRPEYYSKRTIKECFCFGANGKSGKRRVFDPVGRRQCIGSSRATLSAGGILSVTSSGAACNDGERWGQAEMICKNSGPRTPCSWVFKDANNGSQAYQIPFVRVEACGR